MIESRGRAPGGGSSAATSSGSPSPARSEPRWMPSDCKILGQRREEPLQRADAGEQLGIGPVDGLAQQVDRDLALLGVELDRALQDRLLVAVRACRCRSPSSRRGRRRRTSRAARAPAWWRRRGSGSTGRRSGRPCDVARREQRDVDPLAQRRLAGGGGLVGAGSRPTRRRSRSARGRPCDRRAAPRRRARGAARPPRARPWSCRCRWCRGTRRASSPDRAGGGPAPCAWSWSRRGGAAPDRRPGSARGGARALDRGRGRPRLGDGLGVLPRADGARGADRGRGSRARTPRCEIGRLAPRHARERFGVGLRHRARGDDGAELPLLEHDGAPAGLAMSSPTCFEILVFGLNWKSELRSAIGTAPCVASARSASSWLPRCPPCAPPLQISIARRARVLPSTRSRRVLLRRRELEAELVGGGAQRARPRGRGRRRRPRGSRAAAGERVVPRAIELGVGGRRRRRRERDRRRADAAVRRTAPGGDARLVELAEAARSRRARGTAVTASICSGVNGYSGSSSCDARRRTSRRGDRGGGRSIASISSRWRWLDEPDRRRIALEAIDQRARQLAAAAPRRRRRGTTSRRRPTARRRRSRAGRRSPAGGA